MTQMTFSQKNKMAHQMGAFYENGNWYFPSPALKQEFERKTSGMEWTPQQRAVADFALEAQRKAMENWKPAATSGVMASDEALLRFAIKHYKGEFNEAVMIDFMRELLRTCGVNERVLMGWVSQQHGDWLFSPASEGEPNDPAYKWTPVYTNGVALPQTPSREQIETAMRQRYYANKDNAGRRVMLITVEDAVDVAMEHVAGVPPSAAPSAEVQRFLAYVAQIEDHKLPDDWNITRELTAGDFRAMARALGVQASYTPRCICKAGWGGVPMPELCRAHGVKASPAPITNDEAALLAVSVGKALFSGMAGGERTYLMTKSDLGRFARAVQEASTSGVPPTRQPLDMEAAWQAYQSFPMDAAEDSDEQQRKAVEAAVRAAHGVEGKTR